MRTREIALVDTMPLLVDAMPLFVDAMPLFVDAMSFIVRRCNVIASQETCVYTVVLGDRKLVADTQAYFYQ
ncbi:MAG: hypothetical protein HWQ58_09815 [Nostoc sp. LPT]|nr:hypothetical protein [Nostoc sp. LPT]